MDLARNVDVHVMLVGATARDIALAEEGQDAALRATNDVDVAVAVESAAAFERLTGGLEPVSPSSVHKFFVDGIEVDLGGGRAIRVASIAAQVALKLFAWVDRGTSTERDAVDFRTLIHAYSTRDRLDDVYAEENLETLELLDYEMRDAGAHQLGRDVRAQLGNEVASPRMARASR